MGSPHVPIALDEPHLHVVARKWHPSKASSARKRQAIVTIGLKAKSEPAEFLICTAAPTSEAFISNAKGLIIGGYVVIGDTSPVRLNFPTLL